MKVRVSYTTDASEAYRRALSCRWGEDGKLATRDEIRTHLEHVGISEDDDIMEEWRECSVPGCYRPEVE